MSTYHLQIVTPEAVKFNGLAEKVLVRTVSGDVCILANHIDYAAPLAIGQAQLTTADGSVRYAACNSGFISVTNGEVSIASTTFEWSDEIDVQRAERARTAAEQMIKSATHGDHDYVIADAKLRRALARLNASSR